MAKVSFSSLKLQNKNDVQMVEFNNQKIEVKQYISVEEKHDLINIVLQKSFEENIYNLVKIDLYFHLYLVYLYTNINFTDKQREDEIKLYDLLASSGLLDSILSVIPEEEYEALYYYLEETKEEIAKFNTSALGMLSSLMADLPVQAKNAADILNSFDVSQFKEVINFAKSANNGNPVE